MLVDDTSVGKFRFDVQTTLREFHLEAESEEERGAWVSQAKLTLGFHITYYDQVQHLTEHAAMFH